MSELSSKEKAALRGVAQNLKPAVNVGKQGLQAGVVKELNYCFSRLELIKVAFKGDRKEIEALVAEVEVATGSQCVGGVGKRRSFYKALPSS